MKKEYYTDPDDPIFTKSDSYTKKTSCSKCKKLDNLFIEYKNKLICMKCFEKLPGEVRT